MTTEPLRETVSVGTPGEGEVAAMAEAAEFAAPRLQRRLSLLGGLLREAGPVPSARHLHWLCFAAQELGSAPREFDFMLRGGEAFSPGLDTTIGVMEALDLLVDTQTGSSLLLTDQGRKLACEQSLPISALVALPTAQLAGVGRWLYLTAAGVPKHELAHTYELRFWADPLGVEDLVRKLCASLKG